MGTRNKDVIAKGIYNVGLSLLPSPVAAIIQTIDECKNSEELKNNYKELKKHSEAFSRSIHNTLPITPFSIEVVSVNFIVFCLDRTYEKSFLKQLEEIGDEEGDRVIVNEDSISIELNFPFNRRKAEEWAYSYVECLKDYSVYVKGIIYA